MPEHPLVARLRAVSEISELVAIRTALPYSFIGLLAAVAVFMAIAPSGSLLERFQRAFLDGFGPMAALLVVALARELALRRRLPQVPAVLAAALAFALLVPHLATFDVPRALARSRRERACSSRSLIALAGIALARAGVALTRSAALGSWLGAGALRRLRRARPRRRDRAGRRARCESSRRSGTWATASRRSSRSRSSRRCCGRSASTARPSWPAIVLPVYLTLQAQNTEASRARPRAPAHRHRLDVPVRLPGRRRRDAPASRFCSCAAASRGVRTVARAALVPSLFNVNEPLMFGLPIVLEPGLGAAVRRRRRWSSGPSPTSRWRTASSLGRSTTRPHPGRRRSASWFATGDWRAMRPRRLQHRARLRALRAVRRGVRASRSAPRRARAATSHEGLPRAALARFPVAPAVAAAARRCAGGLEAAGCRGTRAEVHANVIAAFLAEGHRRERSRRDARLRLRRRGPRRATSRCSRGSSARERALARLSFVSGTHAIVTALAACAPPGTRSSPSTGRPYDTLRNAIVDAPHSLVARGVRYEEVPLDAGRRLDLDGARRGRRARRPRVAFVQRSRGYAPRRSLSASTNAARSSACVRAAAPQALVLVDNCYGELVERARTARTPAPMPSWAR